MASFALLRRCTAQIFRSRAVANSIYPLFIGNSRGATDRMITTGSGGVSWPAAPWLMMKPCGGAYAAETAWRFYCFSKNLVFTFIPEEDKEIPQPHMDSEAVELVGSSHGWLASCYRKSRDLYLYDPVTNRDVKLPPLDLMCGEEEIHSVVLSDSDEREGKAFVTFGSGRSLTLCSLGGSDGWTLFGGGDYDSVVYSSRHRRLFCITSAFKLEAWDVGGETQTLDNDWTARLDYQKSARPGLMRQNYVVCEERSGELYLVVRHVRAGGGSWVKRGVERVYEGPTVDFEVYKMDREEREKVVLTEMRDSLEGLSMFVGINDAIATRDVGGKVKPDAIYFGYDSRLRPIDRHDYGVFDYRKRGLCREKSGYRVDVLDNHICALPVWFTPRRFNASISI